MEADRITFEVTLRQRLVGHDDPLHEAFVQGVFGRRDRGGDGARARNCFARLRVRVALVGEQVDHGVERRAGADHEA